MRSVHAQAALETEPDPLADNEALMALHTSVSKRHVAMRRWFVRYVSAASLAACAGNASAQSDAGQKANYADKVARGDFSTRTTARPTSPPKKDRNLNALQWAKIRSTARISGPRRVIDAEVFGNRTGRA
jgi:hypothetical protein